MFQTLGLISLGILVGLFSGFFGIGGGIVMIPALMYLMHMDPRVVVGTSLAVIMPTALFGTITHSAHGNVDLRVAFLLATGAALGSVLGASLVTWVPEKLLQRLLGAVFLLVAARLLGGR
ncbi:hypothetical protein EDD75_0599 [Thermodesulfitimonas autotrophica]|uniref:Probable membrane transporter protein n=1 Tax=Thermodesulfitimonas autotrophica TaxID=1894989 RepID=A0A3N5AWY6_9THEO|nr:sulfite exporter TauE/SafE family protein [Thermodesulfitimonas autotrophica]RPF49776.1 hypothetical protein EDD75_0599 [Thermodesulfitimonas autotrophica]